MTTVMETLEERGVRFEVVDHPRAFTSVAEALAMGIAADDVLKSLLVDTTRGHVLVVLPGGSRLDMQRMRHAVGDPHAHLATEGEIEQDLPEVDLGALPPLGSLFAMPTYVDPEVLRHETVVFAAGTQERSLRARVDDVFREEPIEVAPMVRTGDEDQELMG
jgi:Ala-tRNA(Pro) deacylase